MNYFMAIGFIAVIACFIYFYKTKIQFHSIQAEYELKRDNSDALRGIAIFTVVTHHLVQELESPGILLPYRGLGYLSVAVFFLLSGYGLSKQYCNTEEVKTNWGNYWKKRLCKIYIPLVIVECLIYIMSCLIYHAEFVFEDMLERIFCEWYMQMLTVWYIVFFLIYYLIRNRKMRILLHLTASVAIVIVCISKGFFKSYYDTAFCFPLGILWAEYNQEIYGIMKSYGKKIMILMLLLTGIFAVIGYGKKEMAPLICRMFSAITFCILVVGISYYCDFGKNKIANVLGKCSLMIYLLHYPLLLMSLEKWGFGVLLVLFYYGILVVLGVAVTRCIGRINSRYNKK